MATLREARLAAGLSVHDLAVRSGVSMSTIHRIQCRQTRPRPRVVRRLSAALGVSPDEVAEFRPTAGALMLRPPTIKAC
jgi:transcriptional regulator with XRE-family HTH domain